jgi:peptide/nickel transport system ATP-binding protein
MSAAPADIVLDVRHVSVEYASASSAVRAVDAVSFALARGQILGLAGESGGKTTLANAIARLLRPPRARYREACIPRARCGAGAREAASAPADVLADADELRLRWRRLSMVFQSAMNSLNRC